ncbi:MAG TPA: PIG-L family deacetylase [Jatrophihabitans sp.]|jgi:LmbE family N-acetylglucosaminyl deacetylase
MSFTIVSFHAHPDDEVLLTGGTLAKAVAEGHRVVVVVATGGEHGLAAADEMTDLGGRRERELEASAAALGCHRVVYLGYPDSGMDNEHSGFADVDVEQAATRLAVVLQEEAADALTTYDARGGYGHPDHVQVHRVGSRAAEIARTRLVLQATVDRTTLGRAVTLLERLRLLPGSVSAAELRQAYAPRTAITHRINVRGQADRKRAAMAAHLTQTQGDERRTLSMLIGLPKPLFRLVCGTEWFIESGRQPIGRPSGDILESVR